MNQLAAGFEVLDVHHHVGNAFRALGGNLESAPHLAAEDYACSEIESRLTIMDAAGVAQALVIPGHGYERAGGIADTRARERCNRCLSRCHARSLSRGHRDR